MSWGAGFLTSPRRLHRARGRKADVRVGLEEANGEPSVPVGGQ
jgi:hypothetical protein